MISSRTIVINSQDTLKKSIFRVKGLPKWGLRVFFPRSIIFKSTNEMWKLAVEKIGKESNFALIDVSNRSASIDWEIDYLKTYKKDNFIVMVNSKLITNSLKDEFGEYLIEYENDKLTKFERNLKAKFKEMSSRN